MTLSDRLAAPQEGSSGAAEVRTPKMTPHDRTDKDQNRSVEAIGAGTPDMVRTFIKLLLLMIKKNIFPE